MTGVQTCALPISLRRTIQREVDNRLSAQLLDGRLQPGQHVTVGVRDGQLDLEVTGAPEPAAAGAASG